MGTAKPKPKLPPRRKVLDFTTGASTEPRPNSEPAPPEAKSKTHPVWIDRRLFEALKVHCAMLSVTMTKRVTQILREELARNGVMVE